MRRRRKREEALAVKQKKVEHRPARAPVPPRLTFFPPSPQNSAHFFPPCSCFSSFSLPSLGPSQQVGKWPWQKRPKKRETPFLSCSFFGAGVKTICLALHTQRTPVSRLFSPRSFLLLPPAAEFLGRRKLCTKSLLQREFQRANSNISAVLILRRES